MRKYRCFLKLIAISLMVPLTACVNNNAPASYHRLPVVTDSKQERQSNNLQLAVAVPHASAGLNTQSIPVMDSGGAIRYLKDVSWSDRVPRLLQSSLAGSLSAAGLYRAVGMPDSVAGPDHILEGNLYAFEISLSPSRRAVIHYTARIVTRRTGQVLGEKTFFVAVPIQSDDTASMLASLKQAHLLIIGKVISWIGRL